MINYYKILGILQNSTQSEIKAAYKQLAKQWHPDINKSINAHDMFIQIHEAYEILSNPEKRSLHDELIRDYNNVAVSSREYKQKKHDNFVKEAKERAQSVSRMNYDLFLKTFFLGIDYAKSIFWALMGLVFIFASIYVALDGHIGDTIFPMLFGLGFLKIGYDGFMKK